MSNVLVLSPGDGYAIVCGLGLGFAAVMVLLSFITNRYTSFAVTSTEEFSSASRSVRPMLLACGVVSAATWAATLLNSAAVTFTYGLAGCYWYGAGSVSQIMLFTQNAIMLKRNAPGAHTFLEVIRVRWGSGLTHHVFTFMALGTNILLTGQLITGGADTVVALTGANIYAVCVLIPLTVVLYTAVGGFRATLLSDFAHTGLIMAILFAFMFCTFATNPDLGSPSKVYDLLTVAAQNYPLAGNAQGSYMTFRSTDGLVFGIIVIISGITTVFADQTYWQRGVASQASTALKGYLLGGVAFMPIPWAFSTAAALGLVALSASAGSDRLTNPGLAAPAAAVALMGTSGATLLLIVLFLAVTSAASAELVAVSSIIVYDIYMPYINPRASEKQVLWVTHASVVGYGVFMAIIGIAFYEAGISLGWLYGLTGCMFSCVVPPVGFCIRTKIANKIGCITGACLGFVCAIVAWVVTAKQYYGVVNVTSTGGSYPQLAGNAAGIIISFLCCAISSWVSPDNYDFDIMRRHNFSTNEEVKVAPTTPAVEEDTKDVANAEKTIAVDAQGEPLPVNNINDVDETQLYRDFKISVWSTGIAFFVLCILIPALCASVPVFSKRGFTFWVVLAFIWAWATTFVVVVGPVWESRKELKAICRAIINDITGKGLTKA